MWIMIAGPYSHGTVNPAQKLDNHVKLNQFAYKVLQKGHIPVIGVNMALPVIEFNNQASFEEVMMPVSLALAERCDAALRIGGASRGADQEVEIFDHADKPVYQSLNEIPEV